MESRAVTIDIRSDSARYEVRVGQDLLVSAGTWLRSRLSESSTRIVLISNPTVFSIYGDTATRSLKEAGFRVFPHLIGDGEEFKTLDTAESALEFLSSNGITRTDAVVALGGGVVGDLSGFVSAIYMRRIAYFQIPTTLLSAIDSSVGGKTGVNSSYGKNLIGAFHHPRGVLIDTGSLLTLPQREITAGLCEAVKHGALGGLEILETVVEFNRAFPPRKLNISLATDHHFHQKLGELIIQNVRFKAQIVSGDSQESADRVDSTSRKILNFGHTFAHALEKVTDYRVFKHGEAVGYGIMFAAELSKSLALCDKKVVELLNDVVHSIGTLPPLSGLDAAAILRAFKLDKKNLSGELQMILLEDLGRPVIVSDKNIPPDLLLSTVELILAKSP